MMNKKRTSMAGHLKYALFAPLAAALLLVSNISCTSTTEEALQVCDQMPEFPGGQQAMMKFISENLKYPVAAQENGIQGRVICQFVINRDGSVVDVIVVRSAGDQYLDNEAIRVIKSMPKWIPGKQKGKPVRVKYTIPINFHLDKKDKD